MWYMFIIINSNVKEEILESCPYIMSCSLGPLLINTLMTSINHTLYYLYITSILPRYYLNIPPYSSKLPPHYLHMQSILPLYLVYILVYIFLFKRHSKWLILHNFIASCPLSSKSIKKNIARNVGITHYCQQILDQSVQTLTLAFRENYTPSK